jgi:hypothetical protein
MKELSDADAEFVALILLGASAKLGSGSDFDDLMRTQMETHAPSSPADPMAIGERARLVAASLVSKG